MSLERIRDLRLHGKKPKGVVIVLLGAKPRWLDDDSSLVLVRESDDPRFIDWRPLVGLTVAVFIAQLQPDRILALLAGLEDVGAKVFGVADSSGAYPMTVGAGEQHERCLLRQWRALCQ